MRPPRPVSTQPQVSRDAAFCARLFALDAALQGCSGDLPLTPSCRGGGAGRPVPEQVQGTGTFVTGPRTNTECQSGERAACHL